MEKTLSDEEIYKAFNEIFGSIKEATNIDLSIPEDSKEVHESGSIKFFIEYIGPRGGKSDRIKTDIGKGEKLEFEVVKKLIRSAKIQRCVEGFQQAIENIRKMQLMIRPDSYMRFVNHNEIQPGRFFIKNVSK